MSEPHTCSEPAGEPTDPVVSVIIPAHNAAGTLAETLRSARAQTYTPLEIIVVDDGSTDLTQEIAHRQAEKDARIRVFAQRQRGPGAARNLGIHAAKGVLIAPLDADDLWRPSKIERQVAAIQAGGERVGLAYTWFALIDVKGRILSTGHRPTQSGDVLQACCRGNLIGNGSGALMRKSAILECGGYDETLEGCEDWKLYTSIAERYRYAVVPEHLTGYRQSNHNLTSDVAMIRRSAELVLEQFAHRYPQFEQELREMKCDLYHWLLRRGLQAYRLSQTLQIALALWRFDRRFAFRSLLALPLDWLRSQRPMHEPQARRKGARAALPSYFLVNPVQG